MQGTKQTKNYFYYFYHHGQGMFKNISSNYIIKTVGLYKSLYRI